MQVKSIADFQPSLSYHLSLRPLFCLFLSGLIRQVLLHMEVFIFTSEICFTSSCLIKNAFLSGWSLAESLARISWPWNFCSLCLLPSLSWWATFSIPVKPSCMCSRSWWFLGVCLRMSWKKDWMFMSIFSLYMLGNISCFRHQQILLQ